MAIKPRLLTGLQSSGDLHIGNYFGALKPFKDTYENYESFLMVADYHALTSLKDPVKLRENIKNAVRDYLAIGVDPKKAVIFKQSDVSAHTELAWIFNCLVTVKFLELGHAYKDKVAKGLEANAGLLTYPMLMAADILLYDAEVVPVGEDQRQHIEYAREAAAKFNNAYGTLFKEPKELILKSVGVVPGTDGAKMSKSYGNPIPLFGTKDEIAKAVMSIVTNSSPDEEIANLANAGIESGSFLLPMNLSRIHELFKTKDELKKLYTNNVKNYKVIKEALIEDIDALLSPVRETRAQITDADVAEVLRDGAERAHAVADAKMEAVRKAVGVT